MGMFSRSLMASPYIRESCGNLSENFVSDMKGSIKMNTEDIKNQLSQCFKNGKIEFFIFIDGSKVKRIYTNIKDIDTDTSEETHLNITPHKEKVEFELMKGNNIVYIIEDTYDNILGIAFTQWFKPILRNIVKDKYELEGEIRSDELTGTDYCQVREDGILLFNNFSEMIEFAI